MTLVQHYRRFVEVPPSGLPALRVLLAFPTILFLVGVVLVGLQLSGTSSGAYYGAVHAGTDPSLIEGQPESIRSDEWAVGIPWTIAQVQQRLPDRTATFPGGMDAEIPFALPHRQWSVAFEPQSWGFLVGDVGFGTAWKWWLPGLTLIAAAYVFLVTLVPRRPGVSVMIAVGFFLSPFFQWWYQTSTMLPVVWGAVCLAALQWGVRAQSKHSRWLWAIPVGYLTAVMAFTIYAPFIIPVVIVVLFFGIGVVIQTLRDGMGIGALALRLAPVLVGGVAGAATTAVWLSTKTSTVDGFLGTVYPGGRLTPTGTSSILSLIRTVGSSFTGSLQNIGSFLNINSSEASSFFLLGVFLVPVALWAIVRIRRDGSVLPWTTIALVTVLLLFVAFQYLPGWDPIAHLLFLDRSTGDRVRIGVGFASFALIGCIMRDLDAIDGTVPRWVAAGTAGLFLLSQVAIAAAVQIFSGPQYVWAAAPLWIPVAVVSSAAVFLLARRHSRWGAVAFLVVAIVGTATVNPIYRGVLDLRHTAISQKVMALNKAVPGAWVGIGEPIVSAMLMESGVEAYNGTQGAPSRPMWKNIDPSGRSESVWNRVAGLTWVQRLGEPALSNPQPNLIQSTFDACSTFAQKHVRYVLADVKIVTSPCLERVSSVRMPGPEMSIYRVQPAE